LTKKRVLKNQCGPAREVVQLGLDGLEGLALVDQRFATFDGNVDLKTKFKFE
jgi:hypothetical protein